MKLEEKQKQFKVELSTLLAKYKAEITIEDFGRNYMRDEKMVVTFGYDEKLVEENGSGIIPDLVLGTFVS
ncbi:hypothetical protein [Flavobacterium covae]